MGPRLHGAAQPLAAPRGRQLLDVAQAAERINVPVRFIRRLIFERRIHFYKVGKYVRIAAQDLDDYLDANHVDPT
jgi:excisionase family DNA binding protein